MSGEINPTTHIATDVQSFQEIGGDPNSMEGAYGKIVYNRFLADKKGKNSKGLQNTVHTGGHKTDSSNITGSYMKSIKKKYDPMTAGFSNDQILLKNEL